MDHEVLKEMEKALEGNKTLQKLELSDISDVVVTTLPKEFCRSVLFGIGLNTSLSEVYLYLFSHNWDCPRGGRLVYVSHMLYDSVGCSV